MADTGTQAPLIVFDNVFKIYRTYSSPHHRLLELVSGGRKQYGAETRALDGISFTLERGARLGIVGENGSGKSTLLKVLSGVVTPTSGSVHVSGRISALLELGAGFNPELTGEENIRQYCLLHGMGHDETEEALPHIVRFTELRDAIGHPVKTYSSGMAVRLGFSCAVYVKPEILIVDEALSVGDVYFQNKCLQKIKTMLDEGTTFLYVTHAADAIRSLCQTGIWMDKGKIRLLDNAGKVGAAYQRSVYERMAGSGIHDVDAGNAIADANTNALSCASERHQLFAERVAPLRAGSGEVRIQDIELLDASGTPTDSLAFNSNVDVRVIYRVEKTTDLELSITLGVTDSNGLQIMHFNSAEQGVHVHHSTPDTLHAVDFSFHLPLCPGEYGLMAGVASSYRSPSNRGQLVLQSVVDACIGGARFKIRYPDDDAGKNLWGLVHSPFRVTASAEHAAGESGGELASSQASPRFVRVSTPDVAPFDFVIHGGNDECISHDLARDGTWEPFETSIFSRLVQRGDHILDLGANIGWFTVIATKLLGESGKVMSFEPDRQNARLLRLNKAISDESNIVSIFNMAVSDSVSTQRLYKSQSNQGDHRLFADENERDYTEVAVTTLDALFAQGEQRLPDIVKCDTQGSEARIFRGAKQLFAAGWRPTIIAEFWPFGLSRAGDDAMALWQSLDAMGYIMFEVAEYNPVLVPATRERILERLGGDLSPQSWLFTNLLCIPSGSPRMALIADLLPAT